ncbi:MAG: hypothetical protein ACI9EW_004214 [Cellvibrionaceae bacterium]|jgi:hypothetical protein
MFYRIKQVWWALSAGPLSEADRARVDELLSAAEKELFFKFTINDQNHSIRVVSHLIKQSHTNRSLLKAALLHDVGKTKVGRLSVIDRSVAVAVKGLFPKVSQAWGAGELHQAKRFHLPSIVQMQHAEWGADWVQAAGGDALTVSLIRRHQSKMREIVSEEDYFLMLLQTADDLS